MPMPPATSRLCLAGVTALWLQSRYRMRLTPVISPESRSKEASASAVNRALAEKAARTASLPGRYWVIACLVLLMVGITIYEFRSNPRQSAAKVETAGAMSQVRPRRAVAVLGFRNLAERPDDDWLSTAFTEMLSTELAAGGGLRLVPGEDVARAKRELPLANEDTLAKATLERLRTNPGADVVVLGAYTLLPGKGENRIRLDVRLQDTAAGETIAEQALTGSEDKLFELAAQAGAELRQSLGVNSVSAEAVSAARAALPSNQEAVRLYAEGRAKLVGIRFPGRSRSAGQGGRGRPQLSPGALRAV